ncbi:MAG: hypothetical protein IIC30_06910 [Chloroflexi bacterium]|nr:hypothetical protein [Chloroflexota bacterium]
MGNINIWALGWSVVWVVLAVALFLQLVLRSVPDGDTLWMGVDAAVIVFVLIRLKRSVAALKGSDTPPGRRH